MSGLNLAAAWAVAVGCGWRCYQWELCRWRDCRWGAGCGGRLAEGVRERGRRYHQRASRRHEERPRGAALLVASHCRSVASSEARVRRTRCQRAIGQTRRAALRKHHGSARPQPQDGQSPEHALADRRRDKICWQCKKHQETRDKHLLKINHLNSASTLNFPKLSDISRFAATFKSLMASLLE